MDSRHRRQTPNLGRGDQDSNVLWGRGGDHEIMVRQALQMGLQCHRAGDFQSAAEHYYDALEARHDQPDALHLLGLISFQSGDTDTAKRLIDRAIEVSFDDPIPHITLGDILSSETRYRDAIDSYIRGLEIDPELPEGHNNCGNAQIVMGRYQEAIASFKYALALKPGYAAALNNLGNAQREMGLFSEAIFNYRQALALHPDSAIVHNNLGNALRDFGDLPAAIESHLMALEINPKIMEAHFNLGNAISDLGNFAEAAVHYERAIELQPNFADGHYNLGNARREMGALEQALICYHRTVSIDPRHMDAYNNVSNILVDLGVMDQALAAYRIVLELDPNNSNALHMAAALSGETTAFAPPEYVRELFDTHAKNYDAYIMEQLGYNAPLAMRSLIEELVNVDAPRFALGLDLGCGTGLTCKAFDGLVSTWVGVDLSPNMIAVAEEKNLYNQLYVANIDDFLDTAQEKIEKNQETFDLVVLGDVLIYIGDLDPLFEGVYQCISPDGLFVFTTERAHGDEYTLNPTGRYSHDDAYVRGLAARQNFDVIAHGTRTIRSENGIPVIGSVFVLKPR